MSIGCPYIRAHLGTAKVVQRLPPFLASPASYSFLKFGRWMLTWNKVGVYTPLPSSSGSFSGRSTALGMEPKCAAECTANWCTRCSATSNPDVDRLLFPSISRRMYRMSLYTQTGEEDQPRAQPQHRFRMHCVPGQRWARTIGVISSAAALLWMVRLDNGPQPHPLFFVF